jgi:hypothetical protein
MDPIDNWNSEHAANVKAFFGTPSGELYLDLLRAMRPLPAQSNETNDIVRQSGRQEGYDSALHNLLFVTRPELLNPAGSGAEAYPSLDDNTKWTDDNKPTE